MPPPCDTHASGIGAGDPAFPVLLAMGEQMALELPDQDTEYGARVRRRLRTDMTAWLTSVDSAGTPQPAPVWFLWDADHAAALIYSQPSARRMERITANPRASLHLNDDGAGRDVVVLTGTLVVAPEVAAPDAHPEYVAKYGEWMDQVFGSRAGFAGNFSVPLRFRARRVRGV